MSHLMACHVFMYVASLSPSKRCQLEKAGYRRGVLCHAVSAEWHYKHLSTKALPAGKGGL
ncbi:MAG: hypothetical protein KBT04_03925 [Bacteroidales bacterium]|nr:hypothetical protein [Candidatus Colimorpha onthohippi]